MNPATPALAEMMAVAAATVASSAISPYTADRLAAIRSTLPRPREFVLPQMGDLKKGISYNHVENPPGSRSSVSDLALQDVVVAARLYPAVLRMAVAQATRQRGTRSKARNLARDLEIAANELSVAAVAVLGNEAGTALRAILADYREGAAAQAERRQRQPASKLARTWVFAVWHAAWLGAGGGPGNTREARRFLAACAAGILPATEVSEQVLGRFLRGPAAGT